MALYGTEPLGTIESAMAESLRMAELETDREPEENSMTPRMTGRPRGRVPKSRIARPHSHLYRSSGRKAKGGKHSRRWENSQFMMRYLDEDDELLVEDIVPEHCSALASLFREPGKMKTWREFVNGTEDEQFIFLDGRKKLIVTNEMITEDVFEESFDLSPKSCFQRISRKMRSILKSRHLPIGTLEVFEDELLHCFDSSPDGVTIMIVPNSFDRLLLHAICHYFHLQSTTYHVGDSCHTTVESKSEEFLPPSLTLSQYLQV